MVPAARATPRVEANTTLPKPASFRTSRRSIGCFMDDSSRKKGLCDAIPPPVRRYSRRIEFMVSGIKRGHARYNVVRPRKRISRDAKLATPRLARTSVAQYQPAHLPRGDDVAVDELFVIALDRSTHVQIVDHQTERLAQPLLGDVCQPVDALQLGAIIEVKPRHRILRRLAAVGRLQQIGGA